MSMRPIVTDPRLIGFHTTGQADGAYLNGSRVRKVNSTLGDSHADGALGTIIGSLDAYPDKEPRYAYFVEWDDYPNFACGIGSHRLAPVVNG